MLLIGYVVGEEPLALIRGIHFDFGRNGISVGIVDIIAKDLHPFPDPAIPLLLNHFPGFARIPQRSIPSSSSNRLPFNVGQLNCLGVSFLFVSRYHRVERKGGELP